VPDWLIDSSAGTLNSTSRRPAVEPSRRVTQHCGKHISSNVKSITTANQLGMLSRLRTTL